ncbi:MAG: ribosome-associated translation inhibitor RaiA [Kiritimatiellae bacterium]|nr:ribosome-associated translation inhibitor RaiA [Kiritimatiellia bacterium]
MSIEVTIRHMNSNSGMKEYAEERANKLISQFPRVESVHVIIDVQRHLYEAEVIVQQKGLTAVGAKEHADSARAVIDIAAARAEKQLRKTLSKRVTTHLRKKNKVKE